MVWHLVKGDNVKTCCWCIVYHYCMTITSLSVFLLQRRLVETMRASAVLLFAFLALVFVVAYAAEKVSVYRNIDDYFTMEVV